MKTEDRWARRWVGVALATALVLGACGADATDDVSSIEAPAELALEEEQSEASQDGNEDEVEAVDEAAEALVELTPEMFEELKADEVQRAAVLEEMSAQGLTADEAECFLDNVSSGLFITFGAGDQPDDAQFAELLQLLEICEIAFGAES